MSLHPRENMVIEGLGVFALIIMCVLCVAILPFLLVFALTGKAVEWVGSRLDVTA